MPRKFLKSFTRRYHQKFCIKVYCFILRMSVHFNKQLRAHTSMWKIQDLNSSNNVSIEVSILMESTQVPAAIQECVFCQEVKVAARTGEFCTLS